MKTTSDFLKMKQTGEKIVMMTAYDYPAACFASVVPFLSALAYSRLIRCF